MASHTSTPIGERVSVPGTMFVGIAIEISEADGTTFEGCRLVVPPGVEHLDMVDTKAIENGVVAGLGAILEVVLPAGFLGLGHSVFESFEKLRYINFPAGVRSIDAYAFYDCVHLQAVDLPDSVTTIGESAFLYCEGLRTLRMSPNVAEVHVGTFAHCRSLPAVLDWSGLSGLRFIDTEAFKMCSSLRRVVLPGELERISPTAFMDCENLGSVVGAPSVLSTHPHVDVTLAGRCYSGDWLFPFFGPQQSVLDTRRGHVGSRSLFMVVELCVRKSYQLGHVAELPPELVEFVLSFLSMHDSRFLHF